MDCVSRLGGHKMKKNKVGIFLGVIGVVLCVVIIVLIIVLLKRDNQQTETIDDSMSNTSITSVITEEGQVVEKVDPGYFTVEMQLLASSSNGKDFQGTISNALDNLYQVFVTIQLEDGTEVYKSPLIPVGSKIDQFSLNQTLEPGEYETVLTFHNVDDAGTNEISSVSVAYMLSVYANK